MNLTKDSVADKSFQEIVERAEALRRFVIEACCWLSSEVDARRKSQQPLLLLIDGDHRRLAFRPAWAIWMPGTAPYCLRKPAILAKGWMWSSR